MFGVFRFGLRSFALGLAIGVLFAPRPGADTRRMLSTRIAAWVDRLIELGGLPPVAPERARTNGHTERGAAKRSRAGTDARA